MTDWDQVRQKIADGKAVRDRSLTPSPEIREATLRRRAQQMACAEAPLLRTERLVVIVFELAGEGYAVEAGFVREVSPLTDLTPLPCTPPFVRGIINLRGELWPVIDLKPLFGLAERALTGAAKAIILHDKAMEFGLLADAVIGVQSIDTTEIQPPSVISSGHQSFLRGVARDHTMILDASRLLAHSEFVVSEHVHTN
jgi:purine-binding chemotaxis protein CheW